tara:strand:- start:23 stop:880 length:858 start_codon:yes stop_codon:yes gene_type:complete
MTRQIFIHIGFGRCSTTTLQTNIFYKLAEKKNLNYIYGKSLISQKTIIKKNYDNDLNYKIYLEKINELSKSNINNIFLSDESLICSTGRVWCPSTYDESLEKNLKFFGPNVNILITIRKPSDWLLSIFSRLSDGVPFEKFFLNKNQFENSDQIKKFLITDFDYDRIIEKYKARFRNVFIVKYEELNELKFLSKLFNINQNDLKDFQKIYEATVIRRGYRNYYTFKTNQIFGVLNKYLNFSKFFNYEKALNVLDKIYPNKKIHFDFEKIGVDIQELDRKYNKIPSI